MNVFHQILFSAFFLLLNPQQKNSLIEWKPDYRLTWDDFKQRPDANSSNAALTSSSIKFNFRYAGNKLEFHIQCSFDENSSWGRVKTAYILSHEQGHFDITEMYARKLNKVLKEYTVGNPNNISKDLNKIYDQTMKQLNAVQDLYDKETNFSINKMEQAEWLAKIQSEMKKLEAYANYN
jgi:hypothetical protein